MSIARINPDLVDAFCTTCKADVMVGPSLTCPTCGNEVEPTSLAVMPKRVPAEAPKSAQRAAVLPRIRASVQLDGALDAVIVALEAEERAAQLSRVGERLAGQPIPLLRRLVRLLRGLVKVAGEPVGSSSKPTAVASAGKRWARQFDACVTCGRTEIKHASNGRCGSCDTAWRKAGKPS